MTSGTGNDPKGLTLVEILASVVILSFGAVVTMQALGRVASALSVAEYQGEAYLFAMAKMAEVELALRSGQPVEESSQGSFRLGEHLFRWSLSLSTEPINPQFKAVSLTVAWSDGRHAYERHLNTILQRPSDESAA